MSQCNCGCAQCAAKSSEIWNELGGTEMFEYLQEVPTARRPSRPVAARPPDAGRAAAAPSSASNGNCQQPVILNGFAQGDYRLDPTHLAALHELTLRLRDNPPGPGGVLQIRGHTDPTGSVGTNNALGFARALEVQAFMAAALAKIKVAVRLSPSSPGAKEPVASNTTESGRKRNRRVELRLCQGVAATSFPPSSSSSPEPPLPPPVDYPPPS